MVELRVAVLIFVASTITISGCSSTQMMEIDSNQRHIVEFNKVARSRKGHISLVSGERLAGHSIHLLQDSTSCQVSVGEYYRAPTPSSITIPTSQIADIVFVNRSKGALQGLGVGALLGASGAFLLGVLSGGDSEFSPAQVGAIVAVYIGAPAGGVIGTIVGAAVGSRERFVINEHADIDLNEN